MKFPHEITVIRDSQTIPDSDEEGNATSSAPETQTVPAWVQQQSTTEVKVGPDTVTSNWRVFLPPEVEIEALDRIVWLEKVYEVVGVPDILFTPRGAHHIEANLRLVQTGVSVGS